MGGALFALYVTDQSAFGNMHYTRPDLKAYPAMIKDKSLVYDTVAYEQMMD